MAVIKCTLAKGGKLKVLKVIKFEPGDTIELDEPLELSWRSEKGSKPIVRLSKCLAVQECFRPKDTALRYVIPNPCPGN
jgi:hypothetical protein